MAQPWLDQLLSVVAPKYAYQRAIYRQAVRAFEAASPGDPWRPRRAGASADADIAADEQTLRIKARWLRDNVGFISRGLGQRIDYAIGTGVVRKWGGPHAKALSAAWTEHCKSENCDPEELMSMGAIEALAMGTMDVDGTSLIRLRTRRPEDGLKVPLQYQVLEVDWIDTNRTAPSRTGNRVINGIEYGPIGQRVGYWLFDEHPGSIANGWRAPSLASRLVPADQIIPLFDMSRPSMSRGLTRLKSVIMQTRDLHNYRQAEMLRKDTEARLGIIASGDLNQMSTAPASPSGAQPFGFLGDIPAGGIFQAPPGLNLTSVQPTAMPGYVDTVKMEIKLIAAACGWTYEGCTGDMSEANFSSARIRRLDFKAEIERLQWLTLDPMLCQRIDRAFVQHCKLAGIIPPSATWSCEHTYPRWPHVDPVKDVTGEIMEISAGLGTISAGNRARGNDPDIVAQEWAQDIQRLGPDGLNVLSTMLFMLKGRAPDEGGNPAGATP